MVVARGSLKSDITKPLQQVHLELAEIAWSKDGRFVVVLNCDGYRPQRFAYDSHERRNVSLEPLTAGKPA